MSEEPFYHWTQREDYCPILHGWEWTRTFRVKEKSLPMISDRSTISLKPWVCSSRLKELNTDPVTYLAGEKRNGCGQESLMSPVEGPWKHSAKKASNYQSDDMLAQYLISSYLNTSGIVLDPLARFCSRSYSTLKKITCRVAVWPQ